MNEEHLAHGSDADGGQFGSRAGRSRIGEGSRGSNGSASKQPAKKPLPPTSKGTVQPPKKD